MIRKLAKPIRVSDYMSMAVNDPHVECCISESKFAI